MKGRYLLAVCCALLVVGCQERERRVEETIRARQFILEDTAGTVRAELAVNDSGAAILSLRDAHGVERVVVMAGDGIATVAVLPPDSAVGYAALESFGHERGPSVSVVDSSGRMTEVLSRGLSLPGGRTIGY